MVSGGGCPVPDPWAVRLQNAGVLSVSAHLLAGGLLRRKAAPVNAVQLSSGMIYK